MKVRANTDVKKLAGAITGTVREKGKAELEAIGAAAVNQAIKAVITARGYLTPAGISMVIVPSFRVITGEGEERTLIHMDIIPGGGKEDGNH